MTACPFDESKKMQSFSLKNINGVTPILTKEQALRTQTYQISQMQIDELATYLVSSLGKM